MIDPENYSKYTLRRFAALFDVIYWVLIAVVTVGISGRRSLKSKRQLLAQPAMKKPGVSVRSSARQSR
ncbi:hypothetical protein CKQ90_02340, partial [Klebsiella pneumoniae]